MPLSEVVRALFVSEAYLCGSSGYELLDEVLEKEGEGVRKITNKERMKIRNLLDIKLKDVPIHDWD